jgi:DNA-binding transcriptional LysR family regulator
MDLRRLRSFVAVAESRHFGRAAERLFIAQPALSQQIKALEAELGVVLFTRSTRRVELTPAGERLHQRAGEILYLMDAATVEVRRVHSGEEGVIRLGFIGSATYELMPALSRSLQTDLPMLQVELKGEMLSPEVEAALVERRLDLGVLRPFDIPDGIQVRTLRSEPLVVAVPVDHLAAASNSVALKDLSSEPFVNYVRNGSAMADTVAAACLSVGFEPEIRMEVRETATLVSFVAAGIGVALVPSSVQSVRIPGVVYLPLQDTHPSIDLVVGWRTDGPQGAIAQTLARLQSLVGDG